MPVGRTAVGCLIAVAALVGLMLLVRPAIFSLAPPRDDSAVVVGASVDLAAGPRVVDVALAQSYGLDGERPIGGRRVQVRLVVAPSTGGAFSVVNGASPVDDECPVEIAADRLRDCGGRTWTFDGLAIDAPAPLQRFAVMVREGSVIADLTRPVDPAAP
jgi:hypothetical protein